MRIVSGLAGGIHLRLPPGNGVRPTTDRVKESLFASLGNLEGAVVVDLFCGSGALGLEALSRGAAEVLLIDRDRSVIRTLKENLARVEKAMDGKAGEVTIAPLDVARLPASVVTWRGRAEIILADPPYHPTAGMYGADALLRDTDFAAWAGPSALLVLEHAAGTDLPWYPQGAWRLITAKRYGNVSISTARLTSGFLRA